MEIQSVWRRDHYLFDVHANWRHDTRTASTIEPQNLVTSTAMDTIDTDHGLIYHHHPPMPASNATQTQQPSPLLPRPNYALFMHYNRDIEYYTGSEFDFVTSDHRPSNVHESCSSNQDPFSWKDNECPGVNFAAKFVNNGCKRTSQNIPASSQVDGKRQRIDTPLALQKLLLSLPS